MTVMVGRQSARAFEMQTLLGDFGAFGPNACPDSTKIKGM